MYSFSISTNQLSVLFASYEDLHEYVQQVLGNKKISINQTFKIVSGDISFTEASKAHLFDGRIINQQSYLKQQNRY